MFVIILNIPVYDIQLSQQLFRFRTPTTPFRENLSNYFSFVPPKIILKIIHLDGNMHSGK